MRTRKFYSISEHDKIINGVCLKLISQGYANLDFIVSALQQYHNSLPYEVCIVYILLLQTFYRG